MTVLDILTIAAYIAVNIDILLQIKRIHHTKSSHDLSIFGFSIRYAALIIILIKFLSVGDMPLVIGQVLLVTTFTGYLILAIFYARHRRVK